MGIYNIEELTPPPLNEEEIEKKKQFLKSAFILIGGCLIFISVTGGLCLSGNLNLAGRTSTLTNFSERLEFTAKYQILGVTWLSFCILNVLAQRGKTNAFNPLDGRDIYFKKHSNILQNSFEQFILSAFAQIILVAFINEKWTLRTIPWVNFVFFIGRVAFFIGYPNKRSFGYFCGQLPSFGMILVSLYLFFEHLLG